MRPAHGPEDNPAKSDLADKFQLRIGIAPDSKRNRAQGARLDRVMANHLEIGGQDEVGIRSPLNNGTSRLPGIEPFPVSVADLIPASVMREFQGCQQEFLISQFNRP